MALLFDDIIVIMIIVDICSLVIVVWLEHIDSINQFTILTATSSIGAMTWIPTRAFGNTCAPTATKSKMSLTLNYSSARQ